MQFLMSLLGSVSISLLQQGYEIGLDWLGQFVRAIIESVGIIGVGIICFTRSPSRSISISASKHANSRSSCAA